MEAPATKKKPSFFKKYIFFLCVPIFLGLAYWYISGLYPQYKVTAIISVKDASANSVGNEIRSKYLVKKTLDQLPYQAGFYKPDSPKVELNYDSVPVKLSFTRYNNIDAETWIQIQLTGRNQFALTNGDTISYHKFNEKLSEPYGDFVVLPNPQKLNDAKNYSVRLIEPAKLLDGFYKNLTVQPGPHGTVAVSVVAGTSKKGADFLNTLFHIYNTSNHSTNASNAIAETPLVNNGASEKIRKQIASLENKAAALKKDIARLKTNNTDKAADQTNDQLEETPDDLLQITDADQVRMYKEIKPYMRKPIGQFVQIPHADEIGDPDLNEEINDFNEQEVYRQRLFATEKPTAAQTDSVNKKLMRLQSDIVQKINAFLKEESAYNDRFHKHTDRGDRSQLIRSKETSLASLDKDITAAVDRYRATRKGEEAKIQAPQPGSVLTVVEKPENNIQYIPVNTVLIYAIAGSAGLIIPLVWLLMLWASRVRALRLIDKEKLNDQLNDIFAVKQID